MKIEKITLITEDGIEFASDLDSVSRKKLFPPMGIASIGKIKWICERQEICLVVKDGQKKIRWEVLPDASGLLITTSIDNDESHAAIINCDGSVRFNLPNPWPTNPCSSPSDIYGYSYPLVENGKPGFVIYASTLKNNQYGITVEKFYEVDANSGSFKNFHEIK